MSEYYPETKWVVLTVNKELLPVIIYEVERGVFDTLEEAKVLASEIIEQEDCGVQVSKRYWLEVTAEHCWFSPRKKPKLVEQD